MTNATELRVVGMSRSGNHAILNWIYRQANGRRCFLNCAEPKTNPFRSARPLAEGRVFRTSFEGFDLGAERRGAFSRKDWLIHSYEDCFLGMVASEVFEEHHDAWVGSSGRRLDLLIVRDPFNLFASRRRSGFGEVSERTALRIWRQHAREALERGRYLGRERVIVRYNAWARDRAYRRRLAARLGLPFSDAGAHEVPPVGHGSSFDGRRFDGDADRMGVLERWRHQQDDPEFRALFGADTVALAEALFGELPGVRAWLEGKPLEREEQRPQRA